MEDRLLLLLQDGAAERGFTTNWKRLEKAINFIAKQQRMKVRGYGMKMKTTPIIKVSPVNQSIFIPSSSLNFKGVNEETFEKLVRGIKELKLKMTTLKKAAKPNVPQSLGRQKRFVIRCIWCDDSNHKRIDCKSYANAMKNGIIIFKEKRIKDVAIDEFRD